MNKVVSPGAVAGHDRCPSPATTCSAPARRFYDRLDGVRELLTDADTHERAARRQPRAHGDRRGPPHLHLPRRCSATGSTRWSPTGCCPTRSPTRGSSAWKALHAEHLADDRGRASPRCRCSRAELAADELVGLDALRGLRAPRSTATSTPPAVLHEGQPLRGRTRGDGARRCRSTCPFADRDDLELGRRGDELLVRVGPVPPGHCCCPTRCASGRSPRRRCGTAGCGSRSPRRAEAGSSGTEPSRRRRGHGIHPMTTDSFGDDSGSPDPPADDALLRVASRRCRRRRPRRSPRRRPCSMWPRSW